MTNITIPPAALEAGAKTLCAKAGYAWTETPDVHTHWREQARAAFLAMIAAWPGAMFGNFAEDDKVRVELILPLPQETPDDMA